MTAARRRHVRVACGVCAVLGISAAPGLRDMPGAVATSPAVPPSCAPAPSPTTFTSSTVVPIPDTGSTASQIVVTGLGSQGAWDIDVVTRIRHPAPGELQIELVSPDGRRRTLSSGNGGSAADAFNGTVWDDFADRDGQVPYDSNPGVATDHPYVSGVVATPLAPEQGLSPSFEGDGVWSLAVTDTVAGNSGSIAGWSLLVTPKGSGAFFPAPLSQTFSSNATVGISAGAPSTVTSSIVVPPSARFNFLDQAPTLSLDLTHARTEDLDVTLASPSGTVVTLTTDNGGATADGFVLSQWGDGFGPSAPRVTDVTFPPPGRSFVPEEPLGAFVGEDPSGMWTLTVHDDTAFEGGALRGWSLTARLAGCTPNAPITITQVTPKAIAGRDLTFDVAATVGPTIASHDMSVQVSLPNVMRFKQLTPSPGGACDTVTFAGVTPQLKCTWPGRTAIGQARSMRVVVRPFVAGFTTVGASVQTPVVTGFGVTSPPTTVFVAPSRVRAANGKFCTIVGTPGPDTIRSTDYTTRRAVICGLGGRDRLSGGSRDDTIDGGAGNDVIDGRGGADRLFGGAGRDNITGGAGSDLLSGGPGPDALRGGAGRDRAVDFGPGDTRSGIEVLSAR